MTPIIHAERLPASVMLPVLGALALLAALSAPALLLVFAVAVLMAWLGWTRPTIGLGGLDPSLIAMPEDT